MNTNTETNKALAILERTEILDVNGYLISRWHLDTLDSEEAVLEFSYTDDEGYIFEFSFNRKSVEEASVVEHTISMVDSVGEIVDIACYVLAPSR